MNKMRWYYQALIMIAGVILVSVIWYFLPGDEYYDPGPAYEVETNFAKPPPITKPPPIMIQVIHGMIGDREIEIKRRQIETGMHYTGTIGEDEINITVEMVEQ